MIDDFLKYEKENELFQLKIQNIKFWHLIRFDIYNEIIQKKDGVSVAHPNQEGRKYRFKMLLSKIKSLSLPLKTFPKFRLEKKDVLVLNHPRRVKEEDKYVCLYTTDLVDKFPKSYYTYEVPYNHTHFRPIPERNIRYTDLIGNHYYTKKIYNKLLGKEILRETDRETATNLIKDINLYFDINLSESFWKKKISSHILSFRNNYQYYSKIIDDINPKIIIQVVSYLSSRFAINQVAKERGIPTVELQHGIMGRYHIAYNFAETMEIDTFPDYIFTFGKYWGENTRLPIDDSKVISVGWPYYEEKVSKQDKINSVKITILFISQGTIGKQLSKIAKQVEEKISSDKYQIIYKLHPGEYDIWRENYPWLINSSIDVIDHNDFDMHYYFNKADIQIGVNSTAIFEGLGYDLKTFIIKIYGYEYMEELYRNGYVKLIESAEELMECLNKDAITMDELDASYFWESNSLEKMLTEINKIAGTDFKSQTNDFAKNRYSE